MEMDAFISNLTELYPVITEELTPLTRFRETNGWDSLIALSVIAMVDEEYGVTLKGQDILNANTVQELFDIIRNKK